MIFRRWFAAFAYVLLIYATLGWAPQPLSYLRSHNALRLSLRLFFLGFIGALFLRLILNRTRELWRYAAAVMVIGAYYAVASRVSIPEEKIHFLEYGLVGVLFARALRSHIQSDVGIALGAFVFGTMAGTLDEEIQRWIPNRHYDPRDILLNAVAVALGLAVYFIVSHQKTSTARAARTTFS